MSKEFRITLPELYDEPTCSGHNNPSGRQGHYIEADNAEDAVVKLMERHNADRHHMSQTQYDVQPWRPEQGPAQRIVGVRVVVKVPDDELVKKLKGFENKLEDFEDELVEVQEELEDRKEKHEQFVERLTRLTDDLLMKGVTGPYVDTLEAIIQESRLL